MSNEKKPIAIVGIGCRFPGSSSSPASFWEMLINETDAIIDVPADRWDNRRFYDENDNKSGKIRAKQGGFLTENIGEFDPMFFGISPREAEPLDPQTRLLLEVAYEAIEDSGHTLKAIRGSRTGVFIGGFTFDNYGLQTIKPNRELINSHTATGVTLTMYSNRLSYTFDLKGPSISIDTACSSSLVSTHYACQSIWNGESEMALVGGVNLMLRAENSILMSKGKFLSKHSRCKAFDSDAGGYVRGEGAGIVLLKPLDKALEDNDRVYALIKGTGANQDGQTNGITVPNGESQKALIHEVYSNSNVNPAKVRYVEAHGTGTPVGDPIEFKALNDALSLNRKGDDKCLIGSVKTNMGHLEAGAGVAGLIKAALCLYHNEVPANLHFNKPNPALNYEKSLLKVPVTRESLPDTRDSFASVNSFGYGGTNAHAVLMQYTKDEKDLSISEIQKKDMFIFPISAASELALKEMVLKFREYLEVTTDKFAQILSNAIYRRTLHTERLSIAATSKADLINKLEAWEEDVQLKGVARFSEINEEAKVVFVYTGMGPQWWKMGRELLDSEPVFYDALLDCDKEFQTISGWSVLEEMKKPEESSRIKETHIAQPANFLVQVGLTKLLEYYGISPDAVVGHSVGEVASQYVSGALSLRMALNISYHRSRLQHKTSGMGSMLAVGLPEEEVLKDLKKYENVSIAAVNSPGSVTLAGDTNQLEMLAKKYEEQGYFNRMLEVSVPYHSPVMNKIEDELLEELANVKGGSTNIDLYSTVTGDIVKGEEINNRYWWKNVRDTVRFNTAINSLARDNYNVFIEIGPHPVLRNSMIECVQNNPKYHFLQTLKRNEPEQLNFFENLAALQAIGCSINWDRWIGKMPHLNLPSYPWQREHFWMESRFSREDRLGRDGSVYLNTQVHSPQPTYETELNKYFFPFLNDHIVHGKVVFPGAGYVAAAIALYQQEVSTKTPFSLENIKFHQVLTVDNNKVQKLYTSFNRENRQYIVQSRDEGENSSWFTRSSGKFTIGKYENSPKNLNIASIRSRMNRQINEEEVYEKLSNSKLEYGPWFRTIKEIEVGDGELIAKIKAYSGLEETDDNFFHPTLLDACFQSMILFDSSEFVPVSIGRIKCYMNPGNEFYCYSYLKYTTVNSAVADLLVCNENGEVLIEIEDFKCQELVSNVAQSTDFLKDSLFEVFWAEEEAKDLQPDQDNVICVFTYDYGLCEPLLKELQGRVIVFQGGTAFRELGDDHFEFNTSDPQGLARVLPDVNTLQILSLLSIDDVSSDKIQSEECLDKIMPHVNLLRYVRDNHKGRLKVSFVTQGSQLVFDNDVVSSVVGGAIHGLARLIGNEMRNCQVNLVDLPGKVGDKIDIVTWQKVAARLMWDGNGFEELAVRNDIIYTKAAKKSISNKEEKLTELVSFKDGPLKLNSSRLGDLDSLRFDYMEKLVPGSDEIEILIDNTSINYKDYLKVCGKITAEALEGTYCEDKIGLDCAGTILSVGKDVKNFSVGDRVIAFARGTYQSSSITSAKLAVKCPEGFYDHGSAIVTSYVTAIYALRDKAMISAGDKVLIHNATGGVGIAAVNYAKSVGAEIFATAGTVEKREYLKSIGISKVYSSRNLDFFHEIMEHTDSYGVDVVLSSLPGEMMHQSMGLLAPYGTYLEIGKKDIIDNASMPMRFFHKNLSYISIDVDRMLRERQDKIQDLLIDVCNYIHAGQLEALPIIKYQASELADAFGLVEASKHIGKVVINFNEQFVEVNTKRKWGVKPDMTYLITGGTNGLGLEIARWLAANGAQNLALVSRSGLKTKQAEIAVENMIRTGVKVKVYTTDIADSNQVNEMFKKLNSELPKLIGVFHGAMVLDDGYLVDMNEQRFNTVLKPKVDGAVNLHHATKNDDLDYFIMFSSISSLIGNVGQANYVAANAFLDAFAWYRHGLGLPATTINLGVLAEAGVVARNKNLETVLDSVGIKSFTNSQVLAGLNRILEEKPVQIGFFDINWKVLSKNIGASGVSLFKNMIAANASSDESLSEKQAAHLQNIKRLSGLERHLYIMNLLTIELAKILKMSESQIAPDKGINFLGIDSILSVELIRRISDELAVDMSPMEFLAGPSVSQLATNIMERIKQDQEVEVV
ncbi:type I polyketide synthase [Fulvivirga ligni]|uniref:type I polyketide synthase n=1 Tax=Fulvivirga ligni TaxID=2904246 RepID=UPI001F36F725|nr:type I polyketide synthase [Fulvivirga ligni]UII23759.1 type I polyketide synthase [Fulvivirga ligni]